MAVHKGLASLRPRCTRSGSSVAVIPVYQFTLETAEFQMWHGMIKQQFYALVGRRRTRSRKLLYQCEFLKMSLTCSSFAR
jgi:hypothetical protein